MKVFGKRSNFALEIGSCSPGTNQLCNVDVFASNQSLHPLDKTVYIPQFIQSLESELKWLTECWDPIKDKLPYSDLTPKENFIRLFNEADDDNTHYLSYRFMDWGPTTDDVSVHIYRTADTIYLPFFLYETSEFFCATVSNSELINILHNSILELRHKGQN